MSITLHYPTPPDSFNPHVTPADILSVPQHCYFREEARHWPTVMDHDFKTEIVTKRGTAGSSPGQLHFPDFALEPALDWLSVYEGSIEEARDLELEQVRERMDARSGDFVWLDVNGLGNPALIQHLGELFGFHRLSMEDVVNTHQRPKVEEFDTYTFVVVQVPRIREGILAWEQVSLFSSDQRLVSFHASHERLLQPLRSRFASGRRLKQSSGDYVLYAALDVLTDYGFDVLNAYDRDLEEVEDRILAGGARLDELDLQVFRRELADLRRVYWNFCEVPRHFLRHDEDYVEEASRPYFRDVEDHAIRILDRVDHLRDSCKGLLELQLGMSGERLNQVMKVLTIVSTVFIPLSFLCGLYGMNFEYMPELGWRYAYPALLSLMSLLVVVMLTLFIRKGWIGSPGPDRVCRPGR